MSGIRRLIPLLDRVLVQRVVKESKSAGGIILPESATPSINEGVVVAVGPGARTHTGELIPCAVKEGDRVLLPEYGGSQVNLNGNNNRKQNTFSWKKRNK